jgi:hypothetical protein
MIRDWGLSIAPLVFTPQGSAPTGAGFEDQEDLELARRRWAEIQASSDSLVDLDDLDAELAKLQG